MRSKILKICSYLLVTLGVIASGASSIGCMLIFIEEPEMPSCMIEE